MALLLSKLPQTLAGLVWLWTLVAVVRDVGTHGRQAGLQWKLILEILLPPTCLVALALLYPSDTVAPLYWLALLGMVMLWIQWWPGTDRRALAKALTLDSAEERRAWLDSLVEKAYEGVYLVDPQTMSYLDVNPSGAAALRYDAEQMRGMSLQVIHPREMQLMTDRIRHIAGEGGRETFTVHASRRDGRRIFVEVTLSRVMRDQDNLVLAVGRDLTRWMRSQRQIEQLNRLLTISSLANRAINREKDERALFQRICEIAVEKGGFVMAWIGWVDPEQIMPMAWSSTLEGKLQLEPISVADQRRLKTPLFRAIESQYVTWENEITADAGMGQLDALHRSQNTHSLAVVPVISKATVVAVLVLCSPQSEIFDPTLTELLRNLAEDLGRAIEMHASERERRAAEQRVHLLSSAVEQSADAVCMLGVDGFIRYVNPRFTDLTGYAEGELVGNSPRSLCFDQAEADKFDKVFADLQQGRKWRGELSKRKKNGEQFWCMDTISPIRDSQGQVIQYVSTSEDYTALKQAQEKIQELAFYDPLTGLPNRRLLQERLRSIIRDPRAREAPVAVLLLDMDRFKMLNDSKGHHYGDQLLKVIARRLQDLVAPGDTAARLGGDEFAVVLTNIDQSHDAAFTAERILLAMRESVVLEDVTIPSSVSIGIALYPHDGSDVNELLRKADIAMYHAKSQGRNNFQYFTSDINQAALEHLAMEHRLKKAVDDGLLEPFYQSIWDVEGKVLGMEALARWREQDGTLISPAVFIPIAEESGMIEALGELVLRRALSDMAHFCRQGRHPEMFVSVNLSAEQFRRPERLLAVLERSLQESGLEPRRLELEITESMLVQDVERAIQTMEQIRQLGIRLVIDDFGTGYSSLNYLGRFPVDKLKIDKSFIDDVHGPRGLMIASAIIALGSRLGMHVVAEGVELAEQRDTLHAHGCEQFQGFLLGRPMPAQEMDRVLNQAPGSKS